MKKIYLFLTMLVFSLATLGPRALAQAQNVASMSGNVTDVTGAAIPGTIVLLTNKATGVKLTQTTNGNGEYLISNVPPGPGYTASFTRPGFSPLSVSDIYMNVATTRTQNAKLEAGANVEIAVTASNSNVTIDTTDATIGNNFEVKQLNDLPVQQRNDPTALFTLQPGVTDQGAVTGARVDQNYVTLDGLDVNDFATGGAVQSNSGVSSGFEIVGHAPIDSVQEFRGTVGGYQAESGYGSGGQFALVTKSGTNQFHGNINEYHRDPSLVADSWFGDNASPIIPRNHLIQNQFGGNIGGPIKKDKLFFFFDYNNSRVIASVLTARTVPLTTLRNGIIQYINSSGNLGQLTPAQVAALDPTGVGEDTAFLSLINARFPVSNAAGGDGINSGGYNFNAPDNDLETNYVGRVDYDLTPKQRLFARFTISRENSVENVNEFSGDPATDPFVDRTYAFVIGHNWQIGNDKSNALYLGETVQKNYFPNDYNPDGSTFYTFGDGTQASLTSSLYLNPAAQSRRVPIPVVGDDFAWTKGSHTWQFGGNFKDIKADDKNVIDYNTIEEGLGGEIFNLNSSLRPSDIYVAPANATNAQTSLANEANETYDQAFAFMLGRIADVNSDYNYTLAGNSLNQLTGDNRAYRYYQTELYAADTWKATPNLTVSYGVNYQLFSVPYEINGLESTETMSFNNYMAARIKQSNAGLTGPTAVPLISYVLGGKPNNGPPIYQPQYNNVAPRLAFAWNPDFDKKTVFNASAGIVYDRTVINAIQFIQDEDSYLFQLTQPTPYGTAGNPNASIATDPRLSASEIAAPSTIATTLGLSAPAPPKAPYQPFVTNGIPGGLANGDAFNATIDPTLKTPYSMVFNAGMQTQLRGDLVLKINYAGRFGRRLLAQADANQILEFPDAASGQLYSAAFAAMTLANRAGVNPLNTPVQPWFEHVLAPGYGAAHPVLDANGNVIQAFTSNTQFLAYTYAGEIHNGDFGDFTQAINSLSTSNTAFVPAVPLNVGSAAQFSENTFYTNKGFSSYNALLVSLQKNLSHGLQFDINYTFSHSIDNVSLFANSSGDTGIGGTGLICDDIRPRECRANSDFDVTNYITGDETYQLPFGRGRQFLANAPLALNELIGGWDISGVTEYHSGLAWGTNSDAFDASYSNDAPGILIGPKSAVATHVTYQPGGGVNIFANQAAAMAAYEGPIGFEIGSRNTLRGPHFFDQDLGLAKMFPLYAERVNLRFRADAFNAFNHPNFGLPQENGYNGFDQQDVTSTTFGTISDTVTPAGNLNNGARVLQLSLRLEF